MSKSVYAKFFAQNCHLLIGFSGREITMFIYLASQINMATNELTLTKSEKDKAANHLGISPASVNNFLSKYHKNNLMVRLGGGRYLFNPSVVNRSRGDKQLELSSVYKMEREKRDN